MDVIVASNAVANAMEHVARYVYVVKKIAYADVKIVLALATTNVAWLAIAILN